VQDLIAAAEAAADAAGDVIRPLFRQGVAADVKSDASPVTIADRDAEQAMRALLTLRFPEHGILGEEFGHEREGARFCWVLDPVDGTRAFITGRPMFGTLIALLDGARPVLGVIDQPITGERWIGAVGQPTRFDGPYGRPGCRPCPRLAEAELSCTSPDLFSKAQADSFGRVQQAVRRTSWGGDCYAYGLLALGGIDAIVEPGMKLWDWAALVPVIEGAGGLVRSWRGEVLHPDGEGDVVAVGDPAIMPQIVGLLA
jgi:histidinol phosphatase-like enzyme (inositol monophosphatase family)